MRACITFKSLLFIVVNKNLLAISPKTLNHGSVVFFGFAFVILSHGEGKETTHAGPFSSNKKYNVKLKPRTWGQLHVYASYSH